MKTKTLLATGIALAFSSSIAVADVGDPTQTVNIDWDGTTGGTSYDAVGSLDWAVGSSLSVDSINDVTDYNYDFSTNIIGQTADCITNCDFDIYTHAALQGYQDAGGNPRGITGLNSTFEWTFILGASEDIATQSLNQTKVFDADGDGNNATNSAGDIYTVQNTLTFEGSQNVTTGGDGQSQAEGFFFEIYYDTNVNADSLSGLGYDDGQLILSGDILTFIEGGFSADAFAYTDTNGDGIFDGGPNAGGGDITIADPNDPNFVYLAMDSFGPDNWNDGIASATNPECDTNANANPGEDCWSVQGQGATQLEATTDVVDNDFFMETLLALISDLVWSTQNVDPFLETNPSGCYDTTAGTGGAIDCNHVFGYLWDATTGDTGASINGGNTCANSAPGDGCVTGEDILFQTDANQGFRIERVPEPGTMALLGLGLMGIAGVRRRKRSV